MKVEKAFIIMEAYYIVRDSLYVFVMVDVDHRFLDFLCWENTKRSAIPCGEGVSHHHVISHPPPSPRKKIKLLLVFHLPWMLMWLLRGTRCVLSWHSAFSVVRLWARECRYDTETFLVTNAFGFFVIVVVLFRIVFFFLSLFFEITSQHLYLT